MSPQGVSAAQSPFRPRLVTSNADEPPGCVCSAVAIQAQVGHLLGQIRFVDDIGEIVEGADKGDFAAVVPLDNNVSVTRSIVIMVLADVFFEPRFWSRTVRRIINVR